MKIKLSLFIALTCAAFGLFGQTNISVSNAEVKDILIGNYNPSTYAASNITDSHNQILCEIQNDISADSLKTLLVEMNRFHTRNTFSDTVSPDSGIGAARRWAYQRFVNYGNRNEQRLKASYLTFDWAGGTCGGGSGLKNIMGVLPGNDTVDKSIIIIEAHFDSRCETTCDVACEAKGMEDNASGSALVIELARVLSRYTFDETIVFMLTIGEEQGLLGGHAMAQYCEDNNIAIKAVQNNDVIGGVICGKTSSPPSCAVEGEIDSLNVRLFSSASLAGPYRTFARTIKIFYEEKLTGHLGVPMTINIMNSEDRGGRGGDHIPFRERGYRNVRFSSANEHGHGAPDSNYTDRQHTSDDILGVDTDNDMEIDSFYVDFNYLARNTLINGTSATLLALGPPTPDFILHDEPTGLRVEIISQTNMPEYRVGVRSLSSADFDAVYRFSGTSFLIPGQILNQSLFVSVAAIDSNTIMSAFSAEQRKVSDVATPAGTTDHFPYSAICNLVGLPQYEVNQRVPIHLIDALPNPFEHETNIGIEIANSTAFENASIVITDNVGKELKRLVIPVKEGKSNVTYKHSGRAGIYFYSLVVDGQVYETKKMMVK